MANNMSVYRLPWPLNDVVHLTIENYRFQLDESDLEFLIEELSKEVQHG